MALCALWAGAAKDLHVLRAWDVLLHVCDPAPEVAHSGMIVALCEGEEG